MLFRLSLASVPWEQFRRSMCTADAPRFPFRRGVRRVVQHDVDPAHDVEHFREGRLALRRGLRPRHVRRRRREPPFPPDDCSVG